ncbi:MAG: tRNA guanosine(34) transglycosylase Tgt [Nanoarchaeota archaeon]
MTFKIKYKDKKTKARVGILKTKKGFLETPLFLPVATKTAVKFIDSLRLKELNVKAIISNSFILSLNSGLISLIEKMKGIGNFMNFKGINFTDSGGFQMYSQALYEKSNDKGVLFKNPVNGEKIFMTPEENIKLQLRLSSEIAMCLDSMPLYENSKKEIQDAVRKTILWAKRCKEAHDKLQKNKNVYNKNKRIKRQLIFGITQGGIYQDLREYCIKELIKYKFDGYAIGGFGLGEKRKDEFKIIELHKKLIPENKPIYLMGIGDPIEILEAIKLGCDIFDSRMPTQNARHGTLFTSQGKLRMFNKKYESDKNPIDKRCKCFVCKNYSRAYIRFLLREEEPVGKELASYHNLYYLQSLIEKSKVAIRKNKFFEFVKSVKMVYKN